MNKLEENIKNKEVETKKVITIPKTNEEFIAQFKDSLNRYMSRGNSEDLDLLNEEFDIEFRGVMTLDGYHKVKFELLKEFVEDFIKDEIEEMMENMNKDTKEVLDKVLASRYDEIIKMKMVGYVDYICNKVGDYLIDMSPIEEILIDRKEKVLNTTKDLEIYEYLSTNYEELISDIAESIWKNPTLIKKEDNTEFEKINWTDYSISKFLEDGISFVLALPLNITFDMEWSSAIDLSYELEKIIEDVKNGKIKDINTFDLSEYVRIY